MFYDILDKKRKEILPLLGKFKKDFYLAGGTSLTLQLGHRDSIDFDFFKFNDLDTKKLFEKIKKIFKNYKITKIQEEENTLTILIDKNIKISFFSYKYPLLKKPTIEENLNLASIEDIACMKLSAIISRATNKDYIDIYFILKKIKLEKILKLSQKKYPEIDQNLILKSLIYFKDIKMEPIIFKHNEDVNFEEIKETLIKEVKKISL